LKKNEMISWSEALQNNKGQCGIDLAGGVLMASVRDEVSNYTYEQGQLDDNTARWYSEL